MTRLRSALPAATLALFVVCLLPCRALAQEPADQHAIEAPAHVAFVEGTATLERDGRAESSPLNMPLLAGDRLRTQNGRVEVLFGDGSVLHVDAGTLVDFQSDELVRLRTGRVRLAIPGATRSVSYRIDAPLASAEIGQGGEYRMGLVSGERGDEIELDVIRGAADLVNEHGRTRLRAGERAFARASAAPSDPYVYNSASWDAFDQWSETRRDERLGASSQYLPEDVRPYAASFDTYGSWDYQPSYGYVWYPRVAVGWRPYYNGRWATLRPYGWTWIGADPWAWPTHHYGRWGFSAGAWFWIPGRSWGPAWVSWAYAPGYVSWCPLGWNNRAVIQIGYTHARGYDPWRAWTVVPDRHFHAGYVNVRAAGRFDLDAHTRTAFTAGSNAPAYGGSAVPRGTAPIQAAGTRRRTSTSPLYTNVDPRDSRIGNAPSRTTVGPVAPAGEARGQRSLTSAVAPPSERATATARRPGDGASAGAAPAPTRITGDRAEPAYQDRGGYGRIERTPSGTAVPRDGAGGNRMSREPAAPRRGVDMGVGGDMPAPETRATPSPYQGNYTARPGRERGIDAPGNGAVGQPRAMPRAGDSPAYAPRAPEAAPPRASAPESAPRGRAPEPRGADRAPSAGAPSRGSSGSAGGHARPNGTGPTGQAAPRGRGGR